MDNLKTSFGKRKVSKNSKTKLVQEIFTNVAKNYDLMNDLMSFGAHRLWKKELIDMLNIQKNEKIIDIGSGTGDLIKLLLKKKLKNEIYSVDLNNTMLDFGKRRFKNKKVKFINANAEKLPFKNNTFDKYIISFCLRNITNIKIALRESLRILKPGGVFYCLEFSSPESSLVNSSYQFYKNNMIPLIGKIIAKDELAYRYLEESIDQFPNQKELLTNLNYIGYHETNYINLFNGIVCIHKGFKT